MTVLHPIPKRDTVPFVLLSRTAGTRGGLWEIPQLEASKDYINDSLCKMFSQDLDCAAAYDRTGTWGLITLLYLRSDEMDKMDQFRQQLTMWDFLNMEFDTYPKDVIVARPELVILLKDSMKAFQTEMIPKILFSRNKESLAGSLRVIATRLFQEGEKSHKGESKEKWRQIDLKGDDQILRCLRKFPESTPFQLGVDRVQIRGGLRPQEPPIPLVPPRTKRVWEDTRLRNEQETTELTSSSSSASSMGINQYNTAKRGRPDRRGRGGTRGRGHGF